VLLAFVKIVAAVTVPCLHLAVVPLGSATEVALEAHQDPLAQGIVVAVAKASA
jgi:hypothetical protein